MEVTVYEDPACSWCWAFEPVATLFAFELGHLIRWRRVMGGLRDRPAVDDEFIVGQWKKAASVSGMPFEPSIWTHHSLRTTFPACRAVKAASMVSEGAGARFLRRLREAFYVEQTPIDDVEAILRLAEDVGLNAETLTENITSGRAEALFARDRAEAAQHGFGFPTLILKNTTHDAPRTLQGAVPYSDVLQHVIALGISARERRRFKDTREDWAHLFKIHRRLAFAEIYAVTGIPKERLDARLPELGLRQRGSFYEIGSAGDLRADEAVVSTAAGATAPVAPVDAAVGAEVDAGVDASGPADGAVEGDAT